MKFSGKFIHNGLIEGYKLSIFGVWPYGVVMLFFNCRGNLSTYKELCSLASDLNRPDLVYKFMHLANHHSLWNSKKVGGATGHVRSHEVTCDATTNHVIVICSYDVISDICIHTPHAPYTPPQTPHMHISHTTHTHLAHHTCTSHTGCSIWFLHHCFPGTGAAGPLSPHSCPQAVPLQV